jgi:hypothetical protein
MMDCKAIFLDIDGTLVSFKTHTIPASTLEAVKAARCKGIKVYVATGRPLLFIDNLGELEYDGLVTTTGAHCIDREGNSFALRTVDRRDVERLVRHHETCPQEAFPIIFVAQDELFVTGLSPELEDLSRLLNFEIPAVLPVAHALEKDILQIIAFFSPQDEARYMEQLMPGCVAMRWHHTFADIITRGVSKSYGIDRMLEHEGISLNQTIAFGDGGNDIDMLRHVGLGIAMGNASDEVKAAAGFVTRSVDDDGIEYALRTLEIL